MSAGKKRTPPEVIERLLKVARENPELNKTQLGERFGLTPDNVRRVLIRAGLQQTEKREALP